MKTLKDLTTIIDLGYLNGNYVEDKALRQTAIEWIKEMRTFLRKLNYAQGDSFIDGELDLYEEYESSDVSGAVKWIKHFFNITEEELKYD